MQAWKENLTLINHIKIIQNEKKGSTKTAWPHSEYFESTTEQTSVTLELEYFRESVDDTKFEAADEDHNDYVTTDANLELNTINSLIVNA